MHRALHPRAYRAIVKPNPGLRHITDSLHVPDRADFYAEFLRTARPPQRSIDYFSGIPWANAILRNAEYDLVPFYSRYLVEGSGESRFFAQTVNTETSVAHVVALSRRGSDMQVPCAVSEHSRPETHEFMALMHLGRDLESHPGIVNGGFQSVLFDEVMYCTLLRHAHQNAEPDQPRPKHYTLDLKTAFVAPVLAPSDVLVRARLQSRSGRKWFLTAEIVDPHEAVLTRAESWWLTAKSPRQSSGES